MRLCPIINSLSVSQPNPPDTEEARGIILGKLELTGTRDDALHNIGLSLKDHSF